MAIALASLDSAARKKAVGAKATPDKDVGLHGGCWLLGYVVQRKTAYRPQQTAEWPMKNDRIPIKKRPQMYLVK